LVDQGIGTYNLHFVRNKDQKEVDFLVTKNNKPWFLIEAKLSDGNRISDNLKYFQEQLCAKHAFQVVYNLPYVDANCFEYTAPTIVPASTLLSQLI